MEKGFTIIELLVVVAIIGLLASVVVLGLNDAQLKARDTQRLEQIQQISKALNIYYVNNNQFPIETTATTLTGSDDLSNALIAEGAILVVPADPRHPTYTYTYQSDASGSTYTLTFCLETDAIPGYVSGCTNTITP